MGKQENSLRICQIHYIQNRISMHITGNFFLMKENNGQEEGRIKGNFNLLAFLQPLEINTSTVNFQLLIMRYVAS